MIWVLTLEPGREGAWVATTDNDPVCFIAQKVLVLSLDESGNICESLLRAEELEIFSVPVVEWLGVSVVTVL